MKQKIKNLSGLAKTLLVFNFLVMLALPATTLADAPTPACSKFLSQFGLSNGTNVISSSSLPIYCTASSLITQVINYLLVMAGSIAILFIMIGGFWYVTSAGNEEQAEKGRKVLINSIIGLVVVILAATIVRIISSTLTLGK